MTGVDLDTYLVRTGAPALDLDELPSLLERLGTRLRDDETERLVVRLRVLLDACRKLSPSARLNGSSGIMAAMATDPRGVAARSALASAEVTTTLVVAHAAAGGALPSAGWVAAMAAVVFGAGLLVLRGSVRSVVALPALLAAQVGLHLWLSALAPASHPGHAHAAVAGAEVAPDLHLGWPMLVAHLLGAVVTALAWHVRRRAVSTALAWGAAAVVPLTPVRPRPASAGTARPVARHLISLAPRRGPPVALAA